MNVVGHDDGDQQLESLVLLVQAMFKNEVTGERREYPSAKRIKGDEVGPVELLDVGKVAAIFMFSGFI